MTDPSSGAPHERYGDPTSPLPDPNLGWNTYGRGVESIGRDGAPEPIEIPSPGPDQVLVRVDAVGLCFSDVKLIKLGGDHPKLYGRDLATDPTRLGHEATVTIIEVGDSLADAYKPGDRLAIQPDIYVDQRSTAYRLLRMSWFMTHSTGRPTSIRMSVSARSSACSADKTLLSL